MTGTVRTVLVSAAVAAVFATCAPTAPAQYRYNLPPPPVAPTVYAPYAGRGGQLAGGAEMVQAQGQFMNDQEQARITREKAYQEYLKSQKAKFEMDRYIEKNTPTYTELQEKNNAMKTRRILNNPTEAEITTGASLNIMLPLVQQMTSQGIAGPPIALDQATLNRINVKAPNYSGHLAKFKDGGKLKWPIAVRGRELQKGLAATLPDAVAAAQDDTLELKTYNKLRKDVKDLREEVAADYRKNQIDLGSYLAADQFLEDLNFAVGDLTMAGASKALSGAAGGLKGRNVQEMVEYMTRQGLTFAPATPGNENAYFSLQSSMSRYAISTNHGYGMQMQTIEPRKFDPISAP
jgi:hypothetical protein